MRRLDANTKNHRASKRTQPTALSAWLILRCLPWHAGRCAPAQPLLLTPLPGPLPGRPILLWAAPSSTCPARRETPPAAVRSRLHPQTSSGGRPGRCRRFTTPGIQRTRFSSSGCACGVILEALLPAVRRAPMTPTLAYRIRPERRRIQGLCHRPRRQERPAVRSLRRPRDLLCPVGEQAGFQFQPVRQWRRPGLETGRDQRLFRA